MNNVVLTQASVRRKLNRLRLAIYARLAAEGVAWVLLALVGVVAVTFALDYFFRLERPLRGLIMNAALGVVLVVTWRQLVWPLCVRMEPADLALLIERRFRQLGDRLVCAIQFEKRGDYAAVGLSPAMVSRMAAEANELAEPLPFGEVVERGRAFGVWAAAAGVLLVLLGFGLWQRDLLGRWVLRNVLFAEVPWPQNTYLSVQGGPDFPVLRGEDLTVVVGVEDRTKDTGVPHAITIHARYPSVGNTEETVERDPGDPRRFVKVFPAVAEEFEFYVTGGDDRRDRRSPHKVLLIDPPALRGVQFIVRYPNYMNRARPDRFDGGRGVLAVPIGAKVTVEAESNKLLASARIVLNGKVIGEMRPQTVQIEGEKKVLPRRFVGAFEITGRNRPATKTLQFALEDTDGYTNRRGAKYVIQVQPDLPPSVDLKKVGIGPRITPRAIIPLRVRIKDDCGIAGAVVLLRRSATATDANSEPVALPPEPGDRQTVAHDLDIEPRRLKPGLTIHVAARATDTLPKDLGGPNVGRSSTLTFLLVKPEDLMEEFVRRQKAIRLEFDQAMELQESARSRTAAAQGIFAGGQVTAEARRLLRGSGGQQSSVAAEIAKAADSLDNIVEEMKNNRLGTETGREQIRQGIVQPLKELAGPIRKVLGAINATRSVADAAELAEQAASIEEIQKDILKRMADIVQRMQKLESKQELANKLQLIIKWSEQLLEAIRKKRDQEVGRVFKPTTKPAGEGARP